MRNNNKIKILFHTNPNVTSFNAQDINGREIASRLNEEIFEIFFIDVLEEKIDPKLEKNNIHILKVTNKNKFFHKLETFKYKLLYKYDISFYTRVFKNESLFLKLLPFFNFKRKTIHIIENLVPYPTNDKEYQYYAKYNAIHSTKTYSISSAVKKSVKKEYGIDTELIYVGVNTNLFKPIPFENKNNNRLKVLSVGTFQKRKQPDLFADIAKLFPENDFYWIGEGELKEKIKNKKKLENIKNLYIMDNMIHTDLSKFMAKCDIFLFPSIHEGFPKVIIEAMASGLPVIAFDNYKPDAILNEITGFIVSNKEEMIKKLKYLTENKKLRQKMSENSVKRAKIFDWNFIVEKWEDEILKLVRNNN